MSKQNFEELVLQKLTNIETKVGNLETKVDNIEKDVGEMKLEMNIMNRKIDNLDSKSRNLEGAINLNTAYLNQAFVKISDNMNSYSKQF